MLVLALSYVNTSHSNYGLGSVRLTVVSHQSPSLVYQQTICVHTITALALPQFQADPEHLGTLTIFSSISFSVSLFYSLYICISCSNIVNYKLYCFLKSLIHLAGCTQKNMIEAVLGSKVFGLTVQVELIWFSFS